MKQKIKSERGITMIEVLVAIVIFAFGLLAIAGLQLAALKYQKGAWSRAGSATVATDLSERMRANTLAARQGLYQIVGSYSSLKASPPAPSGCDAKAAACTAAEIAQNDLAEWSANLAATLPGGVGTLVGTQATGFLSTVMWFDKDAVDSGGLVTSPACSATPANVTTTCCPAGTPAGVRCVNSTILP
jgi:type IV pilus assembly protein PilV